MKKQDLLIVVFLFALLLAWPMIYTRFFPPPPPPPDKTAAEGETVSPPAQALPTAKGAASPAPSRGASGAVDAVSKPAEVAATPETVVPALHEPEPSQPEERLSLTNVDMVLTFSSRGGGLIATKLLKYRQTVAKLSSAVVLDFSNAPALSYSALPELSSTDNFTIQLVESGSQLRVEKTTSLGLRFTRLISFGSDYQLIVQDTFHNASTQALVLPEAGIQVGSMRLLPQESKTMGIETMGIDVLHSSGGEGIKHFAGDLPKLFKKQAEESARLPRTVSLEAKTPTDWAAVKSKFFVQILAPAGGASGYQLLAERALSPAEIVDPEKTPKSAEVRTVGAKVFVPARSLNPGESASQTLQLYTGPKKYSCLRQLGLHQEDVMEFGLWTPLCKFLLLVLNATYSVIPSYGVAIILLTILIRILFWPLIHKSTESTKKMQQLQPLIAELRKKYKDSPRKLQEETMALYKQHKFNPVSGCLPMLIQIPVFIALFVVLRSAIELRFANFLWIQDLSEPERLLADLLPIPLNILPIFMAATQAWQQAMTPATDPAQQKMLLFFMPVMMLVMFYMMPSALVLYWSTNTVIMIAQQLIQKKRAALKK